MILLFKLALRNLTRNWVRTILNLTMVIGAFTSIILFKGFANEMIDLLEISVTTGHEGHIQIAKAAVWENNLPKHKEDAYVEDHLEIESRLKALPEVMNVSGRGKAFVLLSNGSRTVGAQVLGFDPVVATTVEGSLLIEEGAGFSKKQPFEILMGSGLQKQLQLKVGQTVTVLSQTLAGSINSIEPEVRGVVSTGVTDIDNSTAYIPLAALQKLEGTDRVQRVTLVLNDNVSLKDAIQHIRKIIADRPDLIAKDWRETAVFYQQISSFYGTQNFFVAMILSTLVFFGILNTIGMSVFERTGEIGTMRALGDQRGEILRLLLLEGFLLGLAGAILGTPISALLSRAISSLHIPLLLPGSNRPIPLDFWPTWTNYLEAALIVCGTCLVSSLWPAFKAVRLSIVDALRANS